MEKDGVQFRDIEQAAEQKYKSVGSVQCPYFNEAVHFSSAGFLHLMNKSDSRPRPTKDKLRRYALIDDAIIILKLSRTAQGYSTSRQFVTVSINSRWEKRFTNIYFFSFIALIGLSKRIKIIIRQIEGGEKHFYSVYPLEMSRKLDVG